MVVVQMQVRRMGEDMTRRVAFYFIFQRALVACLCVAVTWRRGLVTGLPSFVRRNARDERLGQIPFVDLALIDGRSRTRTKRTCLERMMAYKQGYLGRLDCKSAIVCLASLDNFDSDTIACNRTET